MLCRFYFVIHFLSAFATALAYPNSENKGVTGIGDSMSPGDIAELSQSNALAFRIIGDVSKLPPRSELYWRALVLDEYDGQRWTSSFINQQPLIRQPGKLFQYPHQGGITNIWLLILLCSG